MFLSSETPSQHFTIRRSKNLGTETSWRHRWKKPKSRHVKKSQHEKGTPPQRLNVKTFMNQNGTMPQDDNTRTSQHHNITMSQHRDIRTLQHCWSRRADNINLLTSLHLPPTRWYQSDISMASDRITCDYRALWPTSRPFPHLREISQTKRY